MRRRVPRNVVGLEITAGRLRGVLLSRSGAPRVAEVPLPAGAVAHAEIVDPAAVTTGLRELWATGKFGTKAVVVGMDGPDVVARRAALPHLDDKDLRSALRFELGDMIPFPIDEAAVEMQPIGTVEDQRGVEQCEVLAIAALRRSVRRITGVARAAGLRPVAVDYLPLAAVRAVAHSTEIEGAGAIVCIAEDTLSVVVHADGVVRFVRTVQTSGAGSVLSGEIEAELIFIEQYRRRAAGAESMTVAAPRADPLVEVIRGTIEYAADAGAPPVDSITLVGLADRCAAIGPQLLATAGVPVRTVDPTHPVHQSSAFVQSIGGTAAAAAFGLALPGDGAAGGPRRLDLAADREPAAGGVAVARRVAAAAVVTIAALAAVTVTSAPDATPVEEQVAAAQAGTVQLRRELAGMAPAVAGAREVATRTARAARIRKQAIDWAAIFSGVRSTAPAGVRVLSIKGRAPEQVKSRRTPGSVEVVAQAPDQAAIGAWLTGLASVPGLRQPWPRTTSTDPNGVTTFTLSAEVAEPSAKGNGS